MRAISSNCITPNTVDNNDYTYLKNSQSENFAKEESKFLKSRTNSILRILENSIESKKSMDSFPDKWLILYFYLKSSVLTGWIL